MKKNYLLLIILFIITITFSLFLNNFIRDYNYLKKGTSILEPHISKVSINELDMALTESNDVILYVGYNYDKNVRRLERDILKKIEIYNLENYVYYCDITDGLDNNKYIGDLISILPGINGKLKTAPALIYLKNKEVIEVVDSYNKLITSNDLEYLINKYQINK